MNQYMGVLITCVVACFHQVMGENQVTGYIGQSATLKSGLNVSWELSRIRWSIYTNTTYIVIYEKGRTKIRFWRYEGRLFLNESTGDLEIKNLTADDSMKYTVLLYSGSKQHQNHIFLTVQEQLRKPKITVLHSSLVQDHCIIALKCSSSEDNVTLSWTPKDESSVPFWKGNTSHNSRESELWTSFKPNRNVTFTCTATKGSRTGSDHAVVQCPDVKPKTNPSPERLRKHFGIIASLACLVTFFAVLLLKNNSLDVNLSERTTLEKEKDRS
ncbi:uncharacterized protein si:cabz01074946.1 isoform X2 [Colossoma macropomum]|uniref:uncharacterized protein si:cabz01074946.1 isoform X2 n=1 Tax=Colossoma macropomum TaxID=42526 RepID=UPI00186405DA|nr:uncharacterized protein si:cabz01074946.1 isoform X2 [Colossoma macropomum]